MARKSKFMHDGSDSSDSGPEDEDTYDPNDPDVAADRELFHSAYRHKRKRANEHDDSVDEGEGFGRRKPAQGKRVDYLKCVCSGPAPVAQSSADRAAQGTVLCRFRVIELERHPRALRAGQPVDRLLPRAERRR